LDKYTSDELRRLAIKLSVFCGVSVDGFLARPDHALDFLDAGSVKGGVVEQMSGEPTEIVMQLKSRGFKHAYIDGGITIQRFLAAGCIDRLVITRVPVLIGAGVPLFGPVHGDINLRHVASRSYKGGLVQSEYEIGAEAQKQ
jgi:dihydrofolate reductase